MLTIMFKSRHPSHTLLDVHNWTTWTTRWGKLSHLICWLIYRRIFERKKSSQIKF